MQMVILDQTRISPGRPYKPRTLIRLPQHTGDLLPNMQTWPDNMDTGAWYYLYIQEATNSHRHVMKDDGIHEAWLYLFEPGNWRLLERSYSTQGIFTVA